MLGENSWLHWSRNSTVWLLRPSFIMTLRRSKHFQGQDPVWREKASHPSHSHGEEHIQLWTLDFADHSFPCSASPSLSSSATELTLAVFPCISLIAKSFVHLNWISQPPCHYLSPLLPPWSIELHINLPIFDKTAFFSILLWHQEKIMHRRAILHSFLTSSSCPEQFKTPSQEMLSSPPQTQMLCRDGVCTWGHCQGWKLASQEGVFRRFEF